MLPLSLSLSTFQRSHKVDADGMSRRRQFSSFKGYAEHAREIAESMVLLSFATLPSVWLIEPTISALKIPQR